MAHVAKVKSLQEAFINDEDVHNVTAMEVFQVDKKSLTSDLRRKAKIINFGIIYEFYHTVWHFSWRSQIQKQKVSLKVIF